MDYPFHHRSGQRFCLIDTPGIDDTNTDNASIFRKIATLLCTMFDGQSLVLGGMIYVQRITDLRMSGSSLNSLRMFEKICGKDCFKNVLIVTTMWKLLKTQEAWDAAKLRERILKNTPEFFGNMMAGSAWMEPHEGGIEGAFKIADRLAIMHERVHLQLQIEMKSTRSMTLSETTAGRHLEGELAITRRRIEKEKQEWEDLEHDVCETHEFKEALSEQVKDHGRRVQQIEIDQGSLSVTLKDMWRDQREWYMRTHDPNFQHVVSDGESTIILKLKTKVQELQMEVQAHREEKLAQREEIHDKDKKLEVAKRELDEQIKNEQDAREKAERSKRMRSHQGDFMAAMRNLFFPMAKEPKEPSKPIRRSDSMPLELESSERSNSKPRKRSKRPKGGRENRPDYRRTESSEEYTDQKGTTQQYYSDYYHTGQDQGFHQWYGSDISSSDEGSEMEKPGFSNTTPQPSAHNVTSTMSSYPNEVHAGIRPMIVITDPFRLPRNPQPFNRLPRHYPNEDQNKRQS